MKLLFACVSETPNVKRNDQKNKKKKSTESITNSEKYRNAVSKVQPATIY